MPRPNTYGGNRPDPMSFLLIPVAGSQNTVPASGSSAIPGCSSIRNWQPDTNAVSDRFPIPVSMIYYDNRIRVPFPAGSWYRFWWYPTATGYECRFRQVPDTGFDDIWWQRRIRIISRCLRPVNKIQVGVRVEDPPRTLDHKIKKS